MPLLHLVQEHFGYISDEAIAWIADRLGLQPINVLELVTFYPMYRRQPVGKKHIRVCRTLSCAMAGSYQLRDEIAKAAGIDIKRWEAQFHGHVHGDDEHTHEISDHHVHNPGHGSPIAVSSDGRYSIEFVECLASCGSAPVAMVDDSFYERVTPAAISDLLNGGRASDATLPR